MTDALEDSGLKRTAVTAGDYARATTPDHPNADAYGEIKVHRIVAVDNLGRPLREGEVVHHINGDPMDNRAENLMVMMQSEHTALHAEERRRLRLRMTYYGAMLKDYRRGSGIRQGELAQKLGAGTASFIWRRELAPDHKNHVPMTPREYADAIAAIEAIVEERGGRPDPAKSLQPASEAEGSS